jgi:hypothetical protein
MKKGVITACLDSSGRRARRFYPFPFANSVQAPFTESELSATRGGMTAKEYRWLLIRKLNSDQ